MEYSPGDFYFEYDFFKGGELTEHMGKWHHEYSPEMFQRGEIKEDWHAISSTNDEQWLIGKFDGRSETQYLPGWDKFGAEDSTGIEPYSTELQAASERMLYMHNQMSSMFGSLSDITEEPCDTLDETINTIGRVNPAAWINPFTGMPMKEVRIWGPMGYPDSIKAVNPDKEKYAGNYSYVTYEWKGKTWGLLAFYYLADNGELQAISCSTHDQEPYTN